MRVILKRYVTRDASGRPIVTRIERVTDDEAGRTHFTDERTAHACTGCGHWSLGVDQRRGICQVCQRYECCEHCVGRCQVCQRQLCGHCRRGFVGATSLTACTACLGTLMIRQQVEDQRQRAAVEFERQFQQQRFLQQVRVHQLHVEHARAALQLQAARLGLRFAPPQPPRGLRAFTKRAVKWIGRGIGHATGLR